MRKLIGAVAVAAGMLGVAAAAQAAQIKWTLAGVTFDDGATASGSFVYDATTNTFSQISLSIAAGPVIPEASFASACTEPTCPVQSSANALLAVNPATSGDLTNVKMMFLYFTAPLSDAGETIPLRFGSSATCVDATCGPGSVGRIMNEGRIIGAPYIAPTATATPVPTLSQWSLMLLASLLGGFALMRQRRKS